MIDDIDPVTGLAIAAALWTLWLIICTHQNRGS